MSMTARHLVAAALVASSAGCTASPQTVPPPDTIPLVVTVPPCDGPGRGVRLVAEAPLGSLPEMSIRSLGAHKVICMNAAGRVVEVLSLAEKWRVLHPDVDIPPDVRVPDYMAIVDGLCVLRYARVSGDGGGLSADPSDVAVFPPTAAGNCVRMDDPSRYLPVSPEQREQVLRRLVAH